MTPTSPRIEPTDDMAQVVVEVAGAPVMVLPVNEPGVTDFGVPFRSIDCRERALPVRQADLTRMLLAEPGLGDDERETLGQIGRLLGSTFHCEFYGKLRELKELYAPLDPDSDYVTLKTHTRCLSDHSDDDFIVRFEEALHRANYTRLDTKVIEEAVAAPNEMGLTYVPNFAMFEHLVVYVRGYTKVIRECRTVKSRFRKRKLALDAYSRLVLALKFKADPKLDPFVRSDVFYLRMFKDVPHVDMEMHLPEQGTKVRMRLIDKAQIASPLLLTLVTKMVAFAVHPVLAAAFILAPITAGVNSFFGFQRAKKKHLYEMIHKLYYLTLANNASVLTRMIDSAEDEEYKEAMLAYFFLWKHADHDGLPVERLDTLIEEYLRDKTGVELNFEVTDALAKLLRLGIARRDFAGHYHATPPALALQALQRRWAETVHPE